MSESNSSPPGTPDASLPEMLCGECGAVIPPGVHYCPRCLAAASKAVPVESDRPAVEDEPAGDSEEAPLLEAPAAEEALLLPEAPPSEEVPLPEPPAEAPTVVPPPLEEAPVPLSTGALLCGNCATAITPGAYFCRECGAPVSMAVPASPAAAAPAAAASQPLPPAPSPPARTAAIPVVPPQPPVGGEQPVRWPWIALMVGGSLLALVAFFFSCVILGAAEDMALDTDFSAQQYRMFGLLCCLVPGILFLVGVIFGAVRTFRRSK